MRVIDNAYDAWWFLHDHPKLNVLERTECTLEEMQRAASDESYNFIKDRGGHWWKEWRHITRHALAEILDIYYAKVDETRTVNDDKSKNVHVECWLEFGPFEYGYEAEFGWVDKLKRLNYHDIDLDCGAESFDAALVILANKALEK